MYIRPDAHLFHIYRLLIPRGNPQRTIDKGPYHHIPAWLEEMVRTPAKNPIFSWENTRESSKNTQELRDSPQVKFLECSKPLLRVSHEISISHWSRESTIEGYIMLYTQE